MLQLSLFGLRGGFDYGTLVGSQGAVIKCPEGFRRRKTCNLLPADSLESRAGGGRRPSFDQADHPPSTILSAHA